MPMGSGGGMLESPARPGRNQTVWRDALRRVRAGLPLQSIHTGRAVLFGSCALGEMREYRDIDLVVIAPEFDGPREINQVKQLWMATETDCRIEPIPCGEREWETDEARPILEIARREGIVIPA